jgi:CRISPR-associated protein Cmr6
MSRGTVSSWNGTTGFIEDSVNHARIFFGDRDLQGLKPSEVCPGLEVDYEPGKDARTSKDRARRVRRAGAASAPTAKPPGATVQSPQREVSTAQGTVRAVPEPPTEVPVPRPLQGILRGLPLSERHPGLQLDKFLSPCPKQEQQREVLAELTGVVGSPDLLKDLHARQLATLAALGATPWTRTTAAPLTLHLARASALENAGLCLHALYGFAYLPGTGLKGLARAYAETVWLRDQPDQTAAWKMLEAVFGWAPGSDILGKDERRRQLVKPWKPSQVADHGKDDVGGAGLVIFHDAWPAVWPKLFVDIVNNHHPAYYTDGEDPGDWESPNPVYFLAVPAGTPFEFFLGRRRPDVPAALLNLARLWLDGGLTHLGAGAKTAAGYGSFVAREQSRGAGAALTPAALAVGEATLELATPAFLAGAAGKAADCDLRPATMRGLLRWWWRAMHAGFVEVTTLRRLEAAVWGDTAAGGAVRIDITPLGKVAPVPYDKRAEARKNELPKSPDAKTTQGLWYQSYGMNDGGKQRLYLPVGAKWEIALRARDGFFVLHDHGGKPIPATARRIDRRVVLDQARAALWWLCMVGGVGSKARKGFGNFRLPPELETFPGGSFVTLGRQLRSACGLADTAFNPAWARGPALRQMIDLKRQV